MIIFFYKKLQISTLLFVYEMIWLEEQYNNFSVIQFFSDEELKATIRQLRWSDGIARHITQARRKVQ